MERTELLDFYKITCGECHFFLTEYHNRSKFYIGLFPFIFTGLIVGSFKANEWPHFVILIISSIIVLPLANYLEKAIGRSYKSFLETVTSRAKIEFQLGFHEIPNENGNKVFWFENEPLVNTTHLKNRKIEEGIDSEGWVKNQSERNDGTHSITKSLFKLIYIAATFLIAVNCVQVLVYFLKHC